MKGIVFKSTGSWYYVRLENGQYIDARIRGKLRLLDLKSTNPIAVGDRVELIKTDIDYNIREILPRINYIIRKSNNLSKQTHIIASNIDQAILFVTIIAPHTSQGFIDRFLVAAESFHIPTVLLFNKFDLLDKEAHQIQTEMIGMYEKIGYQCYEISALTGYHTEMIRGLISGKSSLIAGHSGTGKSTLINKLHPGMQLRTAGISGYSNKGKHTTTFAEMHELFENAFIIDTPGIKDFGVVHLEKNEIKEYMIEFTEFAPSCKFNDCTHINEPGCEIKKAVSEGKISAKRYESYLSMYYSE